MHGSKQISIFLRQIGAWTRTPSLLSCIRSYENNCVVETTLCNFWQGSWVDKSLELVKSTSFTSFNAFVTPPDKQQTKIGLWFLPRTSSSRKPPQFQSKHLSRPMFLTWESQVFNKEELSGLSPMIDRQKAFLHELWSFKGIHNFKKI